MIVNAIKTPVVHANDDLFKILTSLPKLKEKSVVVVTSKIVALCEGTVVTIDPEKDVTDQKDELVRQVAEYYMERTESEYHLMLTIKNHVLAVNAGIDASNVEEGFVLWPKDPQNSVNKMWEWLRKKHKIQNLGVVISDSRSFPLKWGVIGTSIAHCGFQALRDYRGSKDLFGRTLRMAQSNIAEALATAAVIEMGEGAEQMPLAVIEDIHDIQFQDRPPVQREVDALAIELEDDAYAPILTKAEWKKGKGK